MRKRPHHQSNESAKDRPHFTAHSTTSEAQRQRTIDALRVRPQTTYDLRRMGIYQAPARIKELRDRGYDIETQLVDLYDRDGYLHPRCALYELIGEPEAQQS